MVLFVEIVVYMCVLVCKEVMLCVCACVCASGTPLSRYPVLPSCPLQRQWCTLSSSTTTTVATTPRLSSSPWTPASGTRAWTYEHTFGGWVGQTCVGRSCWFFLYLCLISFFFCFVFFLREDFDNRCGEFLYEILISMCYYELPAQPQYYHAAHSTLGGKSGVGGEKLKSLGAKFPLPPSR